MDCEGFLARIIQHETDHLDGVLLIDRVSESEQRSLDNDVNTLVVDFESQQRTGSIPSSEELQEELKDWLTRYA